MIIKKAKSMFSSAFLVRPLYLHAVPLSHDLSTMGTGFQNATNARRVSPVVV